MMYIIGSYALAHSGISLGRECSDIDMIGTEQESVELKKRLQTKVMYPINHGKTMFMKTSDHSTIIEVELAWTGSRAYNFIHDFAEKFDGAFSDPVEFGNTGIQVKYATPETVLLMKHSHKYLKNSKHFLKTMRDIQKLEKLGIRIPDEWFSYLKQREKETYDYSHPDLSQNKSQFFDESKTGVVQKYDHDSVHRAIAVKDAPAYLNYMKDNHPVQCDRAKFEQCDFEAKILGVVEESMVLAIERSLVPFNAVKTPSEAFEFALMKVCTSITSGWFREFAWNHYDCAVSKFNQLESIRPFWQHFCAKVEAGEVELKPS